MYARCLEGSVQASLRMPHLLVSPTRTHCGNCYNRVGASRPWRDLLPNSCTPIFAQHMLLGFRPCDGMSRHLGWNPTSSSEGSRSELRLGRDQWPWLKVVIRPISRVAEVAGSRRSRMGQPSYSRDQLHLAAIIRRTRLCIEYTGASKATDFPRPMLAVTAIPPLLRISRVILAYSS